MTRSLLLVVLLVALSIGGLAFARSEPDGIDIAAIRATAEVHRDDAEALSAHVRAQGVTMAEDAIALRDDAAAARSAYGANLAASGSGEILDLDAMVLAHGEAEREALAQSPRFIAFVSLSMPPEALRRVVADMGRSGGVTVLRGFPQGNATLFKRRLAAIWREGETTGSLGIDPRLFRAFGIEAVPSFVMLGADFSPCDGFDCESPLPPHDRIAGNVSVAHVLETFAAGRGPGAALAHVHRARLAGESR